MKEKNTERMYLHITNVFVFKGHFFGLKINYMKKERYFYTFE